MAKFGIALGSGPRGLGFESRHSDQYEEVHPMGGLFCLDWLMSLNLMALARMVLKAYFLTISHQYFILSLCSKCHADIVVTKAVE